MKARQGSTLLETVVGMAVFLLVAVSLYEAVSAAYRAVRLSRIQVITAALANEQFELVRNMSYADVGIVNGLPSGKIPYQQTLTRSGIPFVLTSTIRNIDDPFDGTLGGTPGDTSPADYKLYELAISCADCDGFPLTKFTTNVAPKSLETASTNGALFIQAIDANGQAVAGANVKVINASATPPFTINDVTNAQGSLQLVDVPPGINAYNVLVTKDGYSVDRTYGDESSIVNPLKPHGTVALQQVTQMSFAIDRTSTLNVSSVTDTCNPVPNVDVSLTGAKLNGTNPDQPKFSGAFATDGVGSLQLPALEWDSYQVLLTDAGYDLAGAIPPLPLALSPNTTQNFQLIVSPKAGRSILVTVKDGATQLPLTDASVTLTRNGSFQTLITNRGFMRQSDWSGASGQIDFIDPKRYFSGDGFLETENPDGELRLKTLGGVYSSYGQLESSSFDTGSPSNYYQLQWLPSDQPPLAGANSVRFQLASNNDNETWLFTGPDGTPGTYYAASNTNIHSSHAGNRYMRYKVFLSTENESVTPNISDISFTYTSDCTPPGQLLFANLDAGTYDVDVVRDGYQDHIGTVDISDGWHQIDILMLPN
ncbi:MAG: carboxypeptidase-like regulatory domain-containing protein [Patescibacteria group bacterium]|nr:MAG: carboxypeptidase-like regulatory domain-containing protein [Patescibacteria group bacterium]